MKCKEINIIEYIESRASKETISHVESCKSCIEETQKLMEFSNLLSTHYAEGKRLEEELDKKLRTIDMSKMKKLPDTIVKKITELKEQNLKSKLKKIIGKGKKDVEGLVEGFLTSRMEAMPASPKDITKTKKISRKKKVK